MLPLQSEANQLAIADPEVLEKFNELMASDRGLQILTDAIDEEGIEPAAFENIDVGDVIDV